MILVVHMLMFDVKNRRFCFVNMFGWNPHLTFIYAATFLHCLLLTSVLPDEDCLGLESFSDSDSLQLLILLLFTIYKIYSFNNSILQDQIWNLLVAASSSIVPSDLISDSLIITLTSMFVISVRNWTLKWKNNFKICFFWLYRQLVNSSVATTLQASVDIHKIFNLAFFYFEKEHNGLPLISFI